MDRSISRFLVGLPQGDNKVFLSWRMLKSDLVNDAYLIQRRRKDEPWSTVSVPIKNSTNYIDRTPVSGVFEYRILKIDDIETPSETITVESGKPATNISLRVTLPVAQTENCHQIVMGDIDNDGRIDFVIKYVENNRTRLAGIRGDGKKLWDIDTALPAQSIGWGNGSGHVPFLCWDVDADGRTEVIFHHGGQCWPEQSASYDSGRTGELLAVIDGETGKIKKTIPWPGVNGRVMMTVGYVQGIKNPAAIVILDGTYGYGREDITITAIDIVNSKYLWQAKQNRPAGHNLDVADIDCDNVQEVIVGGVCYDGDGSKRWEAEPFGHTDMSKPANINPDKPGLEIWYLVERDNPGVYLVDYNGKTIFKEPFRHAHFGWIAKHTDKDKGLQIHAAEDRRDKKNPIHHPIFLSNGKHWLDLTNEQSRDLMPVQWDEGSCTVFIHRRQKCIVSLTESGELIPMENGKLPESGRYGRNILLADIIGDFRENIVTYDSSTNEMIVITNTKVSKTKQYSPMEKFYYRHDRSQHGSGYYLYVPPF